MKLDVIPIGRDRPDLVRGLARLRWLEWNQWQPWRDLQWWVDTTAAETGPVGVPVTFVATTGGEVLGGMGVVATERPEYADRGPWVVGVVVRADRRGQGVGTILMSGVVGWAREAGLPHLWVSTGGRAVTFYRRCGFRPVESTVLPTGESVDVLKRSV